MVQTPSGAAQEVQVAIGGDASEFNNAIDGAMESLTGFGKKAGIIAAGGVALLGGALGAKGVSAAKNFESAMADVEKVTDEQTADELSGSIRDMAEDINLSSDELATLASQAGRFGVEGAENIEEFTRVAGEMGAATTLSSEEAGRSLAKVAEATGEPLENAQQLGDGINELSNNFATNSAEITDTAQRAGFALQDMGLQSDEILGISAAMNEVAPTSRRAATMLQQVTEAVGDPENTEQFADLLGVSTEEFQNMRDENPQETILAISEAMGENEEQADALSQNLSNAQSRAFDRLTGRSEDLADAMGTSNKAMEEGGSLSREVSIETETLSGQMQLLRSEVNNLFIGLGQRLVPAVRTLVQGLRTATDIGGRADSMLSNLFDGSTDLSTVLIGEGGEGGILGDMVDRGVEFLRSDAPGEFAGAAGEAIGSGLRTAVRDISNPLRGEDSVFWGFLSDAATWAKNNIPRLFRAVGNALIDAVIEGAKGLYDGLVGNSVLKDQIIDARNWLISNATDLMGGVGSALVGSVTDGIDAARGAVRSGMNRAASAAKTGVNRAQEGIGETVASVTPADLRAALVGLSFELSGTIDVSGDVATMSEVDARLRRAGREADNRGIR